MRDVIPISNEDTLRVRMVQAKIQAIDVKPEAYSREEIEQAYLKRMQVWGELTQAYGVDNSRAWTLLPENGMFIVGADIEPEGH